MRLSQKIQQSTALWSVWGGYLALPQFATNIDYQQEGHPARPNHETEAYVVPLPHKAAKGRGTLRVELTWAFLVCLRKPFSEEQKDRDTRFSGILVVETILNMCVLTGDIALQEKQASRVVLYGFV